MTDRREYSRIETDIYGTLYKDGVEIPIIICNMSEHGIGIRYKYKHCPEDFRIKKGDTFTLHFFDYTNFIEYKERILLCEFIVAHTRRHSTHTYLGCKLTSVSSEYPQYVLDKKSEKYVYIVRHIRKTTA